MTEYWGVTLEETCFSTGMCSHGRDIRATARFRNGKFPLDADEWPCTLCSSVLTFSCGSSLSDVGGPVVSPWNLLPKRSKREGSSCNGRAASGNVGILDDTDPSKVSHGELFSAEEYVLRVAECTSCCHGWYVLLSGVRDQKQKKRRPGSAKILTHGTYSVLSNSLV